MKKVPFDYKVLAGYLLPKGILEYFDVTDVQEEHTGVMEETGDERVLLHIYLDEQDKREEEWHELTPNGFTESRQVNDFPIRDRKVVLHIRRRRWLSADGKNVVLDRYSLIAKDTGYSREFADVLKKIFGYLPDNGPLAGAVL